MKGGGAAQTREKIVAAAARRFVVIVSAEKAVAALRPPVPLELLRFGVERTLAEVGEARLRAGSGAHPRGALQSAGGEQANTVDSLASPDGNLIADYFGPIGDPAGLAARLSATPGVVEHGLFAPEMVSCVLSRARTASSAARAASRIAARERRQTRPAAAAPPRARRSGARARRPRRPRRRPSAQAAASRRAA